MMMFDYLTQHPDEAELFGEAIIIVHGDKRSAISATGRFRRYSDAHRCRRRHRQSPGDYTAR
jgi:hypothetical protein